MRDAEVRHLRGAVGKQEDVGRLDVAMHDAQLVRIAERRQDLRQDADDVACRESLVGLEVVLELAPLDQLHRDVPDAGVLAEVVDRHDVGVGEAARGLRLAAKPLEDLLRMRAGELVGPDGLERHDALDHRVESLVHDAHGAAPQLLPDLVFAELGELDHYTSSGDRDEWMLASRNADRGLSVRTRALPSGARSALRAARFVGSFLHDRRPAARSRSC